MDGHEVRRRTGSSVGWMHHLRSFEVVMGLWWAVEATGYA